MRNTYGFMGYGRRNRSVRRPADWMVRYDDRILELMAIENGSLSFPASMIYHNAGYTADYTYARLKVLVAAGLVKREDKLYEITDLGLAYLHGEINGKELPPPEQEE